MHIGIVSSRRSILRRYLSKISSFRVYSSTFFRLLFSCYSSRYDFNPLDVSLHRSYLIPLFLSLSCLLIKRSYGRQLKYSMKVLPSVWPSKSPSVLRHHAIRRSHPLGRPLIFMCICQFYDKLRIEDQINRPEYRFWHCQDFSEITFFVDFMVFRCVLYKCYRNVRNFFAGQWN